MHFILFTLHFMLFCFGEKYFDRFYALLTITTYVYTKIYLYCLMVENHLQNTFP